MSRQHLILFPAASAALLVLASCAGQLPPPGGPEDRTPPEVLLTSPDTNAVNVTTHEIVLEFSEYVDRRSVEDAVFISPYTGGLEFDWSGTSVTILPKEPLLVNRTYVVSVGTDVVDRRGKNRMAAGFTLAFSTGDSIDRGSITGGVADDKPEGVLVFAYALEGRSPDTLDPARVRPDYVVQTGLKGTFTLSNVANGTYRLLAVRDQYRDYLYQPEIDQYGVLSSDVTVTAEVPAAGPVFFRLGREDTTRPFLTAVRSLAPKSVEVRFSEPVDSLSVLRARFQVVDTTSGRAIPGAAFALDRKLSSAGVLVLETAPDSGATYRLFAEGVTDLVGNPLDPAGADFTAEGGTDTLGPGFVVAGKRDSLKDHRPDTPLLLSFSEPVLQVRAAAGLALRDSSSSAVPFGVHWITDAECVVVPAAPFREGSRYTLELQGNALEDYYGNRRGDSLFVVRFATRDPRTTGFVEGRITDVRGGAEGEIRIIARALGAPAEADHTAVLAGPGPFRFDRLPEGKYRLWAFRDTDSTGTFTPGRPFPWLPAERFVVYSDTVNVRARWNVEGVALNLR